VRSKNWLLGLSGLSAASLICSAASAQTAAPTGATSNDLEEVVVTAEHRSVDLQKLALSVSVISGDEIAGQGITDISQVLQDVPGVVMQGGDGGPSQLSVQGGGGPPNVAIRGLGTPTPNTTGAVAIYEDGVLDTGGGLNFYDMTRVEVLRGPQGTLYGRGATAGAVNLISNDPTQTFEASGRVQFGNYDLIGTQGVLNIPLSNDWSVRAAFNEAHHSGYFSNGMSNEDDYSTRLKLLFSPNADFSALATYETYESNGTGDGQIYVGHGAGDGTVCIAPAQVATVGPNLPQCSPQNTITLPSNPNPTKWNSRLSAADSLDPSLNALGYDPISYRKTALTVNWNLGFARLTYIGGYQTENSTFGTPCICFGPGPGATNMTYQVVKQPFDRTWTQEARLANEGNSALSWQVGAYYYSNRMQSTFSPGYYPATQGVAYTPALAVTQPFAPESEGFFGEANYAFSSTTRLTAGLRETLDHVSQALIIPAFGVDNVNGENLTHLDWKARVDTDLTASNLLYASVATGYRPGAFVNGVAGQNERVTAYEVGSKNRMPGPITLNGDVYYLDYSGFQNVETVNIDGVPTTVLIPLPAKLYGAELEASVQFDSYDKLTISPTFEHATYTANLAGSETDGGTLPNAPKFAVSARFEHVFPLATGAHLNLEADAHYQSSVFTDFSTTDYPSGDPTFTQKAYAIYNASLKFESESGKYWVSLYGKNLGDTLVKLTVYNPNPPFAYVGDPLTFGVMLNARL
jgi:iron complex outermembrane receptor protein